MASRRQPAPPDALEISVSTDRFPAVHAGSESSDRCRVAWWDNAGTKAFLGIGARARCSSIWTDWIALLLNVRKFSGLTLRRGLVGRETGLPCKFALA